MKYTYLLIDICTVMAPLIFSFHPGMDFRRSWRAMLTAIIITAAFFIVGDGYYTSLKIWGFNSQYLTGWYLGNLPIEEVLFFICIPYACIFTYQCITGLVKVEFAKNTRLIITFILVAVSLLIAVCYHNRLYTLYAFGLLAILLAMAGFWVKALWLPQFFITYIVLLIPFFVVNGLLTGTGLSSPVVWYNNWQNMGMRVLTIPIEDFTYGANLLLMNLLIYTRLRTTSF